MRGRPRSSCGRGVVGREEGAGEEGLDGVLLLADVGPDGARGAGSVRGGGRAWAAAWVAILSAMLRNLPVY